MTSITSGCCPDIMTAVQASMTVSSLSVSPVHSAKFLSSGWAPAAPASSGVNAMTKIQRARIQWVCRIMPACRERAHKSKNPAGWAATAAKVPLWSRRARIALLWFIALS